VERRVWAVDSSDGAEDGWLEGIGARLAALDAPVPPAVEPAGELPRFVLRRSRERYLKDIARCHAELLAATATSCA